MSRQSRVVFVCVVGVLAGACVSSSDETETPC